MSKSILLVEDEEHDVIFMQLALERAEVPNPLNVVRDGQEAVEYLKGNGGFANRRRHPLPGLIVMDLRLPRLPGLEVLKWIRSQRTLKTLPVLVCSASNQDSDVESAYALGANGYIIKPSSPTQLTGIVRTIAKYWLQANAPTPNCREWLSVIVSPPQPARSITT